MDKSKLYVALSLNGNRLSEAAGRVLERIGSDQPIEAIVADARKALEEVRAALDGYELENAAMPTEARQ